MAFTVTRESRRVTGNMVTITGTLAFDSSYATNGEPITAAELGLSSIMSLTVMPYGNVVYEWRPTTTPAPTLGGKILAEWTGSTTSGALAEVTNAGNLSSTSNLVQFIAVGYPA